MSLGENIKRIRKEKGLTQKELGIISGINEAQIRRYELGGKNSNPKRETIEKIAEALEVPVYELIDDLQNEIFNLSDHMYFNALFTIFEKAGYQIIQVPCFFNHGDWKVQTVKPDNASEKITAAFNEKLAILTSGCLDYKLRKRRCSSCKNSNFKDCIIQKESIQFSLSIDVLDKYLDYTVENISSLLQEQYKKEKEKQKKMVELLSGINMVVEMPTDDDKKEED